VAREQIFNQLRQRLGVGEIDTARRTSVDKRLQLHPMNTVPARAKLAHAALIDSFEQRISAYQASVSRITKLDSIPQAISGYLGPKLNDVTINAEVEALNLPFETAPGLKIIPWSPKTSMRVSITCCVAAIAETGSVVIASSSRNGISQNFLGDIHIVILKAEDIVGAYEEIWHRIRLAGRLPRHITFISGPSCTGDIEMVMEYGAHGPRQLHIIIVGMSPQDYQPLP